MKKEREEDETIRRVLAEVSLTGERVEFRVDTTLKVPELLMLESTLGLLRERVHEFIDVALRGDDDE